MPDDFSGGANSWKLSLTPGLARHDKQHSTELYISGEYEHYQ